MDNLTHSLVGLFLARAGCKRATPGATAIMIVAANAPDVDVMAWLGGTLAFLRWHRNFTHALVAIPLLAILSVVLVRFISRRKVRWLPAFGIALLGVASHILLDLTNIYGVRLLLPFSGRWFHWDLTPVVDLAIWSVLLLGVAAPFLAGLVGSEMGDKRRTSGAGWAVFSLLLLIAYDGARNLLHDHAVELVDARIYNGLAPRRAGAFPDQNPLTWSGIAELSNAYVLIPVDLRQTYNPDAGTIFPKGDRTPAMQTAMSTAPFEHLLEFVQYPLWVSEPSPDAEHGTRVRLMDLRFGTPMHPGFMAVATVSKTGQLLNSEFSFGEPKPR